MTIAVQCKKCNGSFKVKEEFAGRRGRCPKCQGPLVVPLPPAPHDAAVANLVQPLHGNMKKLVSASSPPAAKNSGNSQGPSPILKDLLDGFHGNIEPVRTTWGYRLGLLLVGMVMLLLPIAYLGFIGLVVYATYLHAVCDTWWIGAIGGGFRGTILTVLAYYGVLFAGSILVLFMIKPLFGRPAQVDRRRSLTRDGEPILFAFVDRVCEAVGVRPPKRINVDAVPNASASLDRGMWSLLLRNELVLTIGMPLVAAMNVQQFAEVLGHEFGHFSQGFGMRMTYLIRSINYWFARVVYERDQWDERLARWGDVNDGRIAAIVGLTILFVMISRGILWLLMVFGHTVAGYMLRQMETDADCCAVRLAGSRILEQNARLLARLTTAHGLAMANLRRFYENGTMGDDLPRLIMLNMEQFPPEMKRELDKAVAESTTGLLDTHPADSDRIRFARQEAAPGMFHADYPASSLFCHFDSICKNVTWDFYREALGPQIKPSDVHPVDILLKGQ